MEKQKKCYAVLRGRKPGIYHAWFGPGGAEEQVRGFEGARYKSFKSREEAESWLRNGGIDGFAGESLRRHGKATTASGEDYPPDTVVIYTDGGCRGNPGPGGYGAVIIDGKKRKEISRGFRLTTNNRMELLACIAALETLKKPSQVVLHSDSSYVVNGINKGWARKWRAKNWMRTAAEPALNSDLWQKLLTLIEDHRVRFLWVRGHAGNFENERCDELAARAAVGKKLYADDIYEAGGRGTPVNKE
ncbi:MAG: ribonuclease HI [Syntrophales bacterium]|nr:ribonuclease HI [Syntrophales bacterium]